MSNVRASKKDEPGSLTQQSLVLYQSEYVFRSSNGVFAAVILGGMGFAFMWIALTVLKLNTDRLTWAVGSTFAISAALLLGGAIYLTGAILVGRRVQLTVSTDGIKYGKSLARWSEVAEFYGINYANGVCLAYARTHRLAYIEETLPTTPLLTFDGYRTLVEQLRNKIAHEQSHLQIEPIPREPS